jgi:hypothetical protein
LPYDFQIFYQKGILNPADGPSRRPDYLADIEEVNQTPVSQLLPALLARIAHQELEKQSSKPKMGSPIGISPITGKNSKPKMGSTKGISPITGKSLKPKMGSTKGISPITGKSSKPKMGSTKGMSPITGKNLEDNGLPANMEETSTPDFLLNNAGKSEALAIVGKVKEV